MTGMIRLRKECPEIGLGRCSIIESGAPNVLALRYDWRGNSVITLHNFDERPHGACLRLPDEGIDRLSNLIAPVEIKARNNRSFEVPLDALDYCWMRVGGLDYAVTRSVRSDSR
jgi:maltose alpha-D-glucosyltransferase/alpha-amylase